MNHQKSTTSGDDETDYFDAIPVDLFTAKILSKLPVKSIAQCRCVSKLWSSQIRRPYYNMLFPIMSPAPPRILFTIENAEGLFFYSSPQPRNPDENTSLVATLHHRTSGNSLRITSPPVGGLLCLEHDRKNYSRVLVISNPITGEFLALPKLRINEIKKELLYLNETYIFGYDPIDKQSKDAERHQWSKHIYQLPNRNLNEVVAAGVVGSSEIVFYRKYTREQDQFFIAYYNLESNKLTKVILEVPQLFSGTCYVNAFTNYVGDVRLM
ncbi:putative F-box protein [Arabidopsis thaliana]